jgi:hypothetical protein
MAKRLGVTPAYGRDYKSKAEIQVDIDKDLDFIISDFVNRWDGKPVNASGAKSAGYTHFTVRYGKLRKQAEFTL